MLPRCTSTYVTEHYENARSSANDDQAERRAHFHMACARTEIAEMAHELDRLRDQRQQLQEQ